jgi:ABC-type transport system involved in multi-copper enzyme maturation permease subunit
MFVGEWRKVTGNRLTTAVFIWSAPILAFLAMGLVIFAALAWEDIRAEYSTAYSQSWTTAFLMGWQLVNSEFGRFVIAAFTAIVFAGEYQFGTWKNFVPYRRRATLLLTKLAVILTLVTLAWVLMTLILGFGALILGQIAGISPGEFNGEIFRQFIADYLFQMVLTLSATSIAACYAALAAMFTRSTLASLFVAFLMNIAETAILVPLVLISQLTRSNLISIYTYTPSFNLMNLQSYYFSGLPASTPTTTERIMSGQTPAASLLILIVWVVVLLAITFWRFNRQDITT